MYELYATHFYDSQFFIFIAIYKLNGALISHAHFQNVHFQRIFFPEREQIYAAMYDVAQYTHKRGAWSIEA